MKRLSIIIPIYNVEPYLERCLRSLEDQDIPGQDYEIICINDGSPDNSREIVMHLQKEFDNILLIDQENQGVSRARNNGIDRASGKYLLFVDPDDYVDKNSFGRILENTEKYNPEVSFLGYSMLDEDGSLQKKVFNENNTSQIYTGINAYFLARGDGNTDPDRMWAVLFKTQFLNQNKLRYLPDVPYLEDGELIARVLGLAERCTFSGQSFYQRTYRPGSATHSNLFYSEKATKGFILSASNLKNFQKERHLNDMQIEFLNQPIAKFVLLAVNSSLAWKAQGRKAFSKFIQTVRSLRTSSLRKVKLDGCNREYRIYGKAYNLSPTLGAIALILIPRINKINIFDSIKKNLTTLQQI